MNERRPLDIDRLNDLLADHAMFGLEGADAAELDAALALAPEFDNDSLEIAAAAVAVAFASAGHATMPAALHAKLSNVGAAPETPKLQLAQDTAPPSAPQTRSQAAIVWSGWLAAAACLLAAVAIWQAQPKPQPPTTVAPPVLSLADRRAALLRSAPDVKHASWEVQNDVSVSGQTTGEVIWSDSRQEGYMTFEALAVNDPGVSQYQLWVFDSERDQRYPVDGALFDISSATGEVTVAITPRLKIQNATMFAITVERPGGVWVSDRTRLPLLAKVQQGS